MLQRICTRYKINTLVDSCPTGLALGAISMDFGADCSALGLDDCQRHLITSVPHLWEYPFAQEKGQHVVALSPAVSDTADILLLLLLLELDDDTLESQIPLGKPLLKALKPLGISSLHPEGMKNRRVLLNSVKQLLGKKEYWKSVLEDIGPKVLQDFSNSKRAKQDELTDAFNLWLLGRRNNTPLFYPSMLQLVYPSGARNHVLVHR